MTVEEQLCGNAAGDAYRPGHGRVPIRVSVEFQRGSESVLVERERAFLLAEVMRSVSLARTYLRAVLPLDDKLVLQHDQVAFTGLEATELFKLGR